MIIRLAEPRKEAAQVLRGVRDFISRMDFVDFLPDSTEDFEDYVIELLASEAVDVIVAEHEGELVAGLGLLYGPLLWNPKVLQVDEVFWWAAPGAPLTAAIRVLKHAMALVDHLEYDGKKLMSFKSLTSSPASVSALYGRLGMREVETSYMRVM